MTSNCRTYEICKGCSGRGIVFNPYYKDAPPYVCPLCNGSGERK